MAWTFVTYVKDYCSNCTLVGLSYIANHNLHFIERIFWLLCVLLSSFGCYSLIKLFEQNFQSKAVSIVIEDMLVDDRIWFPAVSVCELRNRKDISDDIQDYVELLSEGDYDFDIEEYLGLIIYPAEYVRNMAIGMCGKKKMNRCPKDGYRNISMMFGATCSEVFEDCSFAGKTFDCCQYFLPILTPGGKCFLLNSLQNNDPKSDNWLDLEIDPYGDPATMKLIIKKHAQVSFLNKEDIPSKILMDVTINARAFGLNKTLQVFVIPTVNDPDVRQVHTEYRNCRFPDEVMPNSAYKAYSFSACMSDCVSMYQFETCNCTNYVLSPYGHKIYPDCGLDGYLCLDGSGMFHPDGRIVLPWANNKKSCDCLPSCTENYLQSTYEGHSVSNDKIRKENTFILSMPILSMYRYRRQALRTHLDAVVTIGGILGLFLGASVLSGIEFVYYFTIRIYNNIVHLNN